MAKRTKCWKVVKNLGNGKLVSVMLPEWHPLRKTYRTASGTIMRIPQCMVFDSLDRAKEFGYEQARGSANVSCEMLAGETLELWEAEAVIIEPTTRMLGLSYLLDKRYWNKKGQNLGSLMAALRDLELNELFRYWSKENPEYTNIDTNMLAGALEAKKVILTRYIDSYSRR